VAAIQADLESEFVVTFATPVKSTAELPHKLQLRVSRKNIQVSIQSQYYPLTAQ
jgi:hypothetical protein